MTDELYLSQPLSAFISGVETINSVLLELQQTRNKLPELIAFTRNMAIIAEAVVNMKNVNEFMVMTINRCIDYTKASNGVKLVPHMETINLVEVLNLPLSVMKGMNNQRIEISPLDLATNIATHIITDKQWLQENILCLLSNAVKYSTRGAVNVTVSLTVLDTLLVEIEDTGIGIEDSVMESLFNPFKQAQRLAGGTGLGELRARAVFIVCLFFMPTARVRSVFARKACGSPGRPVWSQKEARPNTGIQFLVLNSLQT